MGASRVSQLDFVSHGQSNVENGSKYLTCSYKSIKLVIHATSQTYCVTQLKQHWYISPLVFLENKSIPVATPVSTVYPIPSHLSLGVTPSVRVHHLVLKSHTIVLE